MSRTTKAGSLTKGPRPSLAARVTVVMIATFAIWQVMRWVTVRSFDPGELTVASRFVNALVVFGLAVPLVISGRRYLDRRTWSGLRLTGIREGWKPFVVGSVSWLMPAAVGMAVAQTLGWVEITFLATATETIAYVATLTVAVFLSEALPEELIFRGYLYRNLATAMAPWMAVATQALLFTIFGSALWVMAEGWSVIIERTMIFGVIAVVIGCVRVATANLWSCVGLHLVFQVCAQLLLGTEGDLVAVRGADTLTLVSFAAAFAFATGIASRLTPGEANWRTPEPDPVSTTP